MEIQGQWIIPEFEEQSFYGTLYKKNNKINLHILGELPFFEKSIRFPVIYGKTIKGDYTLMDCIWSGNSSYNTQSQIQEKKLFCNSIIKGHCFKKTEELKFHKFKFNFDGLREWLDMSKVKVDYKTNKVTAEFINPEPISFIINKNIKVTINSEMFPYTSKKNDTIFQINQSIFISLNSDEKIDAENFINLKNLLIQFFFFALNYKIEPYIQRFFNNEIHENKRINELIYIDGNQTEINNFPIRHKFPFKYLDIKDDFEKILELWINNNKELEPIINIWICFFTSEKLNIENKFLLVCQAFEAFHSRFRHKEEKYENGECNRFGTPKFAVRVKKLMFFFKSNISDKIFSDFTNINELSEKIKDTRDYYTHYLRSLEDKVWNEIDLLTYTQQLIAMLHCLILNEIGIKSEIIDKYLKYQNFGNYQDIKDIPTINKIQ